VRFFRGERREMERYIIDAQRDGITHDQQNALLEFVEWAGKGADRPLSYNTIERSFFREFLYKKALDTPLQGLVQAGGECRRAELEEQVEHLMAASLQPGDQGAMARGRERWRVVVQRARRPLVAEGWIEDRNGKLWRITDSGRKAAEQPIAEDPGTRK